MSMIGKTSIAQMALDAVELAGLIPTGNKELTVDVFLPRLRELVESEVVKANHPGNGLPYRHGKDALSDEWTLSDEQRDIALKELGQNRRVFMSANCHMSLDMTEMEVGKLEAQGGESETPITVAPDLLIGAVNFPMKKRAMISKYCHQWPSIEADMADSSRNGLSKAKAASRGWIEGTAVEWAKAKGKWRPTHTNSEQSQPTFPSISQLQNIPTWGNKL